jgi:hypothetical protein
VRYTEIIVYRRNGNRLDAYRVSTSIAHGQHTVKAVEWPELFGNHTSWVAEQVNARIAAQEVRRAA